MSVVEKVSLLKLTVPYSSVKEVWITSPGSFPFFLIGINGMSKCSAIDVPSKKPLDSSATTASGRDVNCDTYSIITSCNARNALGFLSTGNRSLKMVQ